MVYSDKSCQKYLTQTFMSHGNEMICQQVTLSGYAEWPKVADAVIEAWKFITITDQTIKIVDNDAIVRHTLTGETERDGKTNPVKIGVLMVWHKQDGNGKLLAR
jgi:hypothetical protein